MLPQSTKKHDRVIVSAPLGFETMYLPSRRHYYESDSRWTSLPISRDDASCLERTGTAREIPRVKKEQGCGCGGLGRS
jgi:hypothetical protein